MQIGIFDSGLGGLFLAKSIIGELPEYDYIYLGDTKNVPYGNRSGEAVYDLTSAAVDFLFQNNCALVILACNTASALALKRLQIDYLKTHFTDRKILGVLVPAVEAAVSLSPKRVGVLGTRGTVESGAFVEEIRKLGPEIEVVQQASPLLVPLIENDGLKWADGILRTYLEPLRGSDALILGCTHYSIIREAIEAHLRAGTVVISQTDIVPEKLRDYLGRHPEVKSALGKSGEREFLATDLTPHFQKLANEWFGGGIELTLAKY